MKKFRYLIEYWAFLILIRFLLLIGIDRASSLGSFMARKIGPKLRVSKIALNNLKEALGKNVNTEAILDGVWDNFGRYIGEFPYSQHLSIEEVMDRVEIVGSDILQKYRDSNTPFIMMLGHFANWELPIKIATSLYPKFAIIYRKANNPYVNKAVFKLRSVDKNIRFIEKGHKGLKPLAMAIRSKEAIAMLVDQKMNDGIEVPFLGRPAMTAHAIARLSLDYHYPIVPCQIIRKQGCNFKMVIHPSIKYEPLGDTKTDYYNLMVIVNEILGGWVKENPTQWFWFHKRWKN